MCNNSPNTCNSTPLNDYYTQKVDRIPIAQRTYKQKTRRANITENDLPDNKKIAKCNFATDFSQLFVRR